MKNIFILFLLSCTISLFSQEKRKNKIEYINMSSLSITKNSESYFSNYSKDSIKTFEGMSFDLNTIHGAKFFGYISISTGIGLDLNINPTWQYNFINT